MVVAKIKRSPPLEWVIFLLLAILYVPLLWHWVDGWINKSISIQHEYFSHGLLGIPLAGYLVWEKRSHWQALPNRTSLLAWPLLAVAVAFYHSGLLDWMNLSLPILLAGLLLLFKGKAGFKLMLFPWVLVLLATPTQLPYLIEPYILPLQSFIAGVAGFILQQFDVNVFVEGIYLYVNDQLVEVAPHCAGLKMLFTSLYMGLVLAYWTGLIRSWFKTCLFFSGIVGISVVGNILRNAALTYFHGTGMSGAFHWLHDSWGGDVYAAGMLGLLVVLIRLLERFAPDSLNVASPSSDIAITHASDDSSGQQSSQRDRSGRKPPQPPQYF